MRRTFNSLSEAAFVAHYSGVFEHSPWVAQRVAAMRPLDDLHRAMMTAIYAASPDERLALIRAHPELADKLAIAAGLTEASASEQASAGLDRLTADEFARFHAANTAYRARFDFPFIICVRLTDKAGILAAMEARLGNEREEEIATALGQIGEIARLRLADLQGAVA